MKKAIVLLVAVVMALALVVPVSAQGPGEGEPVIEGNFGGSVNFGALNPLRSNDTATNRVTGLMFPTLLGSNINTAFWGKIGEEGVVGALATDWTVSEDGLTYTVTLRDDATWSDGTPITATDVKFSFDAMASGAIDSPGYGFYNYIPDSNVGGIKEINVVDDYTVEVVYEQPTCSGFGYMAFPVIPAAAFGYDGSADFDFTTLVDNEFDTAPSLAFGPFQFASFNPGEAIALAAVNPFADGDVIPSGYVYRDAPDQNVLVEQFLAGETTWIERPPAARYEDIFNAEGVNAVRFEGGGSWDYIGLNTADRSNPQPMLDAEGNMIDQGVHPVLGDARVRRAIQMGLNVPDVIQGAVFGEGAQMASVTLPGSWAADPNLPAVPYDPAAAGALLDEAGWPLGEDGVRVCQGCGTAEDGTPLAFELITNSGNTRREAIGQIVQDELSEIGVQVDFQAIDFQTLIDSVFGAQDYDAYILGWAPGGIVDDPMSSINQFFSPGQDDPANQGSNAGSYYNEEVMNLLAAAQAVPGCSQEDLAPYLHQIQKILQDEQPYIWLYTQNTVYAAHDNVQNFSPVLNAPLWNVFQWSVAAD